MNPGRVTFVGAGPGDPGLLTRLGAEALAQAEVVLYDHLIDPRLLELAPPGAERISVGKRAGHSAMPQHEINERLVALAREGRRVVRLKGGDVYVFGRGAEEAAHLARHGIPYRVVPGVTAGVGVTAYAGLPVTHRDDASAVAFVTGHDIPGAGRLDWEALARFPGTLVVYMGVSRLAAYSAALIAAGKPADTPAALVQWGTWTRQRTVRGTLGTLPGLVAAAGLGPPSLVVIGDVARHHAELDWFERLPLFGRTVLVTRPRAEAARSAHVLEQLGAETLLAPTVEIRPPEDWGPVDRAIDALDTYDWLVFTSANGVRGFLGRLLERGHDLRALGGVRLAAIGPTTAEALGEYHLRADVIPPEYRSESLAATLLPQVDARRVLLARADRGRPLLRDELVRQAGYVEQVAVYGNVDAPTMPACVVDRLAAGSVHWITLTSSAITERLFQLVPEAVRGRVGQEIRIASLSPVTTATAQALGWSVAAEATEATWDGLVRAILRAEADPRNPAPVDQASSR